MSNIKILYPKALHDEDFVAVWPYGKTSFGAKINSSAKHTTFLQRERPEVWALGAFVPIMKDYSNSLDLAQWPDLRICKFSILAGK